MDPIQASLDGIEPVAARRLKMKLLRSAIRITLFSVMTFLGLTVGATAGSVSSVRPVVNQQAGAPPQSGRIETLELKFSTIDYPGALATRALGINAEGTMVGAFDDSETTHGFVLRDGRFAALDFPGATSTLARSINDRGEIVGFYFDSDSNVHGFYLFRGNFRAVDIPFSTSTRAEGISSVGTISGEYVDEGGTEHGYLLHDGRFESFDVPNSSSTDIWSNANDGWFAGDYGDFQTVQAFVRTKHGQYITIALPVGAVAAAARGINDRHQVVGLWDDGVTWHAFFWQNGRLQDVMVPGAIFSVALQINNAGRIVGRYFDSSNNEHGYLACSVDEDAC
jgi:probable HAF family extracellular repeat protein